jgi:hypothetical protein
MEKYGTQTRINYVFAVARRRNDMDTVKGGPTLWNREKVMIQDVQQATCKTCRYKTTHWIALDALSLTYSHISRSLGGHCVFINLLETKRFLNTI